MARGLSLIFGLAVAGLVGLAALLFALGPRFEAERVAALPGPAGVVAEHWQGSAGATTGFVDVVRLTGGWRDVEVLRVDRAEGIGLRWSAPDRLLLCIGQARVFRAEAGARVAGQWIDVQVAPLPAADCGA